jgi:hypothetical protein
MLLLNNADVAKVLDMPLCLAALDGVFKEMAIGGAVGMGRIDIYAPSGEMAAPYYRWAVMTGGSKKDGYVCARMLSDMVSWPREYDRVRENKFARAPGAVMPRVSGKGLSTPLTGSDPRKIFWLSAPNLPPLRIQGANNRASKERFTAPSHRNAGKTSRANSCNISEWRSSFG